MQVNISHAWIQMSHNLQTDPYMHQGHTTAKVFVLGRIPIMETSTIDSLDPRVDLKNLVDLKTLVAQTAAAMASERGVPQTCM